MSKSIGTDNYSTDQKTSSISLRIRAFLLSKKATAIHFILTIATFIALINIGLGLAATYLLLPLLSILAVLFFFQIRKINQLNNQVDSLSHEVALSSEQYQTLTNNIAAAIIIRDATNNLIFCSPFIEILTGYSRQEIYEQGDDIFLQIIHEDDRELYKRAQKVTAYGEAFQYRMRFYHKSGLEMWAESRTVPILNDNGTVTSSLSVLIDITGTALYQRQVEEMNRDMQDFSYMISHDLKAPLATIKGMLTVLQEESPQSLSSDSKEALVHIENAAKRLELLIGAVLEYSRISNTQAEREPTNLTNVLNDIATDFSVQLKSIGSELVLPDESIQILGEQLRVYQIFSNLIGNAIKYRDEKRHLKIEISILPSHTSRWVTVIVKDTGIGIPVDKQAAVFRPFFRAHSTKAEGAGVGLACVKKIIEKLGGQITLKSTAGEGSEFTIKFLKA
jgi:PAS domain S-box-containing protein